MKLNGYTTIESTDEQNQATPPQESSSRPSIMSKKGAIIIVAIGIACLVTFTSSFHRTNGADILFNEAESPMMASGPVRDCSLKECFLAGCPAHTAPFHCKSNNGCSATPWAKGTCDDDDQCSLKICDSYTIPDSAKSCEGVECGAQWCKGWQKCGNVAPFQCLEGASRYGCSSDELSWTIKSGDNVCSKCCDARTC